MNWQAVSGPANSTSSGFGPAPQPASKTDPLTSKETFLKLLMAQMSHQNPLQPADGVEFLSQLTQISGVEQSLEMRTSLESMQQTLADILDVQKKILEKTTPAAGK